ncbi:MAG: hypothetical protein K9L17_11025 [Clostridiales bacterium]|nr:hypothetical protein [Clostridiales bacterium]MCF8023214.1 hypothetical protein [Clostridiales bacterium]
MKKITILFLALMLVVSLGMTAEAQEDIELIIDGETIQPDAPPKIIDGRTLVPARHIFEPLGAKMEWDAQNNIATGILGNQRVDIPIGSKEVTVNGKTKVLDVPAQIFNGRTYIPLRFSGEAFGRDVIWDGATKTITIPSSEEKEKMVLLYTAEEWEEISNLAYSPDGDTIAIGAKEVDLFSVTEREIIASGEDNPEGDRPQSNSLDFSPDGSILGTAWWGVSLWDAKDLTKIDVLHGGHECRVAFSPDGKMLATHPNQTNGVVWLWQAEKGVDFEQVAEFDPEAGGVSAIEFSPDGAYLAAAFRDGEVRLWEVDSGKLAYTFTFEDTGGVRDLAFSPDGKTLAAVVPDLGREVHLFSLEDGSRQKVLDAPDITVSSLDFSPDGTKLASGGYDGLLYVWDTGNCSLLYSVEHDDEINGLSFSPDSKNLAIGTGNGNLYYYEFQKK